MFGNSQMGGVNVGFPDVCLTPPAALPVPYPNVSFGTAAFPPAPNVFWSCTPAHHLMTTPLLSLGDGAGVMGFGVASHLIMSQTRPLTGAFSLLVDGMPATRLGSVNLHNTMNAPGMTVVPSQVKVIILKP
jgi:hypothetical protein